MKSRGRVHKETKRPKGGQKTKDKKPPSTRYHVKQHMPKYFRNLRQYESKSEVNQNEVPDKSDK